jgi:hypothetical protein
VTGPATIERDPAPVELLHEDPVTYTDIHDVRELGRMQTGLRQHLDFVGSTASLTLPRLHDMPLASAAKRREIDESRT